MKEEHETRKRSLSLTLSRNMDMGDRLHIGTQHWWYSLGQAVQYANFLQITLTSQQERLEEADDTSFEMSERLDRIQSTLGYRLPNTTLLRDYSPRQVVDAVNDYFSSRNVFGAVERQENMLRRYMDTEAALERTKDQRDFVAFVFSFSERLNNPILTTREVEDLARLIIGPWFTYAIKYPADVRARFYGVERPSPTTAEWLRRTATPDARHALE